MLQFPSVSRVARPFAAAALFASMFLFAPQAALAKSEFSSWFTYGDNVEKTWRVSAVAGDPNQVRIQPKKKNSSTPVRKIMVVYPRPSSAYKVAITKILEIFAEKSINADITVVNFKKNDKRGKALIKHAEKEHFELMFSMGSESTSWLYKNYNGGVVPVISVCSKDPVLLGQAAAYDQGSGTNFAFTSLNMPVDVQMAYVVDFMPQVKNFAILVDSKNVSAVETQAKPIAAYARQRGMQVHEVSVKNPKKAKEELAKLVKAAVATMRKSDPTLSQSLFWITGSTSVFREIATINAYSDRVPVLSVVPEVVKAGDNSSVMSIGISFESNAHLAAIYGADVLAGRDPGEMPVGIVSPPDIAINFRKAREIGLEIPFKFLESATYVYGYDGQVVRDSRPSVQSLN